MKTPLTPLEKYHIPAWTWEQIANMPNPELCRLRLMLHKARQKAVQAGDWDSVSTLQTCLNALQTFICLRFEAMVFQDPHWRALAATQ